MHLCSKVKNTDELTVLLLHTIKQYRHLIFNKETKSDSIIICKTLLLYSHVITWVLGKIYFACCTGRISHRPTYLKSLLQTPISHFEIKSIYFEEATRQAVAINSSKFTFKKSCSQKGGKSVGIAMATFWLLCNKTQKDEQTRCFHRKRKG